MVNTDQEFLRIRAIDPWTLNLFERAAQFIYLIRPVLEVYSVSMANGGFNVPYGAYDRRYFDPRKSKGSIAFALADVEIKSGDFEFGDVWHY